MGSYSLVDAESRGGTGYLGDYGTVQGSNGNFTVTDDHVYADFGNLPLSVSVANAYGAVNEATANSLANVTSSLVGGFQLGVLAGVSTSLTLAYLPNGLGHSNTFTASINWGDGSADSDVTLTQANNGLYEVTGSHSYPADGLYTAAITVSDAGGNSTSKTEHRGSWRPVCRRSRYADAFFVHRHGRCQLHGQHQLGRREHGLRHSDQRKRCGDDHWEPQIQRG